MNYSFIKIFNNDKVIMADGRELPISQARRKKIREKYLKMEG